MSTDSTHRSGKRKSCFFFLLYGPRTYWTKHRIAVLRRNWRSHGAIIAWSNQYLYEEMMRDHGNSYITYHLVNSEVLPKRGFPVIFQASEVIRNVRSHHHHTSMFLRHPLSGITVRSLSVTLNGIFVRMNQILDLPYFPSN